jgi:hypothetical protein
MGIRRDIAASGTIVAYLAQPYVWFVFGVVVIYLATVGYLWSYLHPTILPYGSSLAAQP